MFILRGLWSLFVIAVVLVGIIFGNLIAQELLPRVHLESDSHDALLFSVGLNVVGGLLGFLVALFSFRKIVSWVNYFERVSLVDKIAGAIGVILGLGVALLVTVPFAPIAGFGLPIRIFASVVGIVLGVGFAMSARGQIVYVFPNLASSLPLGEATARARTKPKMLDTNVIIDGRIADVVESGFLEGALFIPDFILQELHHIADSSDNLRRARGRRGLDMLNTLKNLDDVEVAIYEDYSDEEVSYEEVDTRLVKLAKAKDAAVVTNDYSVNEIAKLNGVPVVNINELANALKPVFLPGEEMTVTVVKEGKEPGQGVGYLDDGTMVVVEGAAGAIGQMVPVTVSSVLQTNAGKMIFAELPKDDRG